MNSIVRLISKQQFREALNAASGQQFSEKDWKDIRSEVQRQFNWWYDHWESLPGAHKRGMYRDLINLSEAVGFETYDTFPDGSLILEVAGRREAAASGECWGILIKAKGTRSKAVAQHILRRLQDQFDAGRYDRPGTVYELELHDCCEHSLEPKCER